MESLGNLTGGIAHDFNNLLTVIIGNISMVKSVALDNDAQRYLRNALKAGESAISLTQGLLAFARKQVLAAAVGGPPAPGGRHARLAGPNARARRCGSRYPRIPTSRPALVDPNQLELIILNLAINANDAMPKGGALSITASNRRPVPMRPMNWRPTTCPFTT